MELSTLGRVNKKAGGMVIIEIAIILSVVLLIMKVGFEDLLYPLKKMVQEVQQERVLYDGKILWKD